MLTDKQKEWLNKLDYDKRKAVVLDLIFANNASAGEVYKYHMQLLRKKDKTVAWLEGHGATEVK